MHKRQFLTAAVTVFWVLSLPILTLAAPIPFGPADSYAMSDPPYRMASGDFNGDGLPDLVTVNTNSYTIFMNNGDTRFTATTYPISLNPSDVAVVNLDYDPHPDLVISEYQNKVLVFGGVGDGTFTLRQSITLSNNVNGMTAGDFNHDGLDDAAVCLSNSGKVAILMGRGDGTLSGPYYLTNTPCREITAGLVNGDGNLDLVTATSSSIYVLLGHGDGSFNNKIGFTGGSDLRGVALADINHDGFLDAVAASYATTAAVILPGQRRGRLYLQQIGHRQRQARTGPRRGLQ